MPATRHDPGRRPTGRGAEGLAAESHRRSLSDAELRQLLANVLRTRDRHRRELQGRAGSPELSMAREAALEALEKYAAALEERSWPIPQRMHQDLQLLRALCGPAGDGRGGARGTLTGSSQASTRRVWGPSGDSSA